MIVVNFVLLISVQLGHSSNRLLLL